MPKKMKKIDWGAVDKNIKNFTSAGKMAEFLDIPKWSFPKLFKEKYGKTYYRYRKQKYSDYDKKNLNHSHKQVKIDWDVVKEHLYARCSITSICFKLGISTTTFYKRCEDDLSMTATELRQSCLETGEGLLKQKMFKKAIEGEGDNQMLIWLSKNWLKYKDKIEEDFEADKNKDITVNFNLGGKKDEK